MPPHPLADGLRPFQWVTSALSSKWPPEVLLETSPGARLAEPRGHLQRVNTAICRRDARWRSGGPPADHVDVEVRVIRQRADRGMERGRILRSQTPSSRADWTRHMRRMTRRRSSAPRCRSATVSRACSSGRRRPATRVDVDQEFHLKPPSPRRGPRDQLVGPGRYRLETFAPAPRSGRDGRSPDWRTMARIPIGCPARL